MTLPTPETPPTMGLHLQRGPIPDSLGPPDPCPAATPNFLSGTQGQLETGSGFSKYAKKMKRKKKRHPLTFHLSLLLMRILWQLSHLTPVTRRNIKDSLSSQRDPVPDTETRCLSASGSFLLLLFFSCPRKRCSVPPWGNLSIGVLLLIWWDMPLTPRILWIQFLSFPWGMFCQPELLAFRIMLQNWRGGVVHWAGVERHLRREKPGDKEHVRQADGRRGRPSGTV